MNRQLSTEQISDRLAISDVVLKYATALDRRDWGLLREILCDRVWIDYRSFDPKYNYEMAAEDWVNEVKALEGFDATQHQSTNHVHKIDGDSATCTSYVQAGHFINRDGKTYARFLYGYYTNELVRTDQGWKIAKVTLTITAWTGDEQIFDWVYK